MSARDPVFPPLRIERLSLTDGLALSARGAAPFGGLGYGTPDDLLTDLTAMVRAELEALQAAGCGFVQIDEPAFHPYFEHSLARATALNCQIMLARSCSPPRIG